MKKRKKNEKNEKRKKKRGKNLKANSKPRKGISLEERWFTQDMVLVRPRTSVIQKCHSQRLGMKRNLSL